MAQAIFLRNQDVNVKALAGVTKPITSALIMRFRRTILSVVIAVQLVLH